MKQFKSLFFMLCTLLAPLASEGAATHEADAYAGWNPDLSFSPHEDESLFWNGHGELTEEYRLPNSRKAQSASETYFSLDSPHLFHEDQLVSDARYQIQQPTETEIPESQTTSGQQPANVTPFGRSPAGQATSSHGPTKIVTPATQVHMPTEVPSAPVPAAPAPAALPAAPPAPAAAPGAVPTLTGAPAPAPLTPQTPAELPAPPPIVQPAPPKTILINFNNVNIIEFIRFISRFSGKNFIFNDADLDFNVTIVSEEPATIENVMAALMQILRVHGLSLNEQGNNILIHTNKAVTSISEVVADGIPINPRLKEAEFITQVFRLNTLDAEKAAAIVQPLISDGALVEALKDTNQVIVTDIATNVTKIGQLLKSMDAPNSGMIIGQYVVVNALLDSIIGLAQTIMEPIAAGNTIVFVPHTPTNSIFVVSTPFLVDRALAILRNLDINIGVTRIYSGDSLRFPGTSQELQAGAGLPKGPLPFGTLESASPWGAELPTGHIEKTKFYIHKLRFRRGDQIVDALGRVGLSLQETGTANTDLISTISSIQWLEASNSLVFTGPITAVAKVKELIEEIDTPLRQVFIEMLILNTTLDDSLDFAVNWGSRFETHNSTFGWQAFISQTNPLAAALDSAVPGGAVNVAGIARQQGYTLGILGRNVTHGGLSFDSVMGIVSAFHNKDKVQILMNPKLLVEDNSTAEIFVGINTAFQISSITNDRGEIITNNFEFRDVGTLMRITPLISNNDIITLDIREEVSSVASTTSTTGSLSTQQPGPTTNISRTVTRVHVPNKYFLVMSGMIQDQYERIRNQVPCLGGAPIIGALFSDKRLTDQKRNIMIFIRPQIVDSVDDIDNLTRHEQDVFRNTNRSPKMWKYEVEEALDFLNIKCPDVSKMDIEEFNP